MTQATESNNTDINSNGASSTSTEYQDGGTALSDLINGQVGMAGMGWNALNKNLICSIYEVDHEGKLFPDTAVLRVVFTGDTNLEVNLTWQSPFEGAGAEAKAPALMAMLQSGALQQLVDTTDGKAPKVIQDTVNEARGRTGITKLNSTQVFSGMPPIKLQGNILLRAWNDPITEVEKILDALMKWSLPISLAGQETMLGNLAEYALNKNDRSLLETIMPSIAPPLLGVTYKGRTYKPMVIENISIPLGSPIDKHGNFTTLVIPITFSTLTAIDGEDWMKTRMSSY